MRLQAAGEDELAGHRAATAPAVNCPSHKDCLQVLPLNLKSQVP